MKTLRYFCDFECFDPRNNLLTWALSHNFNLIFDSISPEIVLTGNDLNPDLIKYNNSKIIYYTGEPFLSWSGEIDRKIVDKALTFFNFEDDFFSRVPLILHYNYEYYKNGYIDDYEFLLKKRIKKNTIPVKFCSFVSRGNGYPSCPRQFFYDKLSSYKQINSHGSFLNDSPMIPMGDISKFQNSLFKVNFIIFNICSTNPFVFITNKYFNFPILFINFDNWIPVLIPSVCFNPKSSKSIIQHQFSVGLI